MISLYTGTPGSGKSLHVAHEIYDWLRYGRNVIANFDIVEEKVKYFRHRHGYFFGVENADLTIAGLCGFAMNFHKRDKSGRILEGQTLIVIDEAQILYNTRAWSSSGRSEWISFFTQHRKYGYEVILITQFDEMLDKQVRALVEYEFLHRKLNNFKLFGSLLALLAGGSLFLCIQKWYCNNQQVSVSYFRGCKKYYDLYNTSKLFSLR